MQQAALRRAFRALPGTSDYAGFAAFLERLDDDEASWSSLVRILERDVTPVVFRHHPAADFDEIASTCTARAFETWVPEWRASLCCVARTRRLLADDRPAEALDVLSRHPRFRGRVGARAQSHWEAARVSEAIALLEGTRSARSHFIARGRAEIREAQRKQLRQSQLMSRSCLEVLAGGANVGRYGLAAAGSQALCGAELDRDPGMRGAWRISAFPPAQLSSHGLSDRVRRMLGAVEALGPDYARVFKLLLEGLSQQSIAKVEGRHPAAISRRVNHLRALCRAQLLD
jgi:DNA-directed RNA polymerase specialized sigma24 family protein